MFIYNKPVSIMAKYKLPTDFLTKDIGGVQVGL